LFEDLVTNPRQVVRDLYEFLGVDPDFTPDFTRRDNAYVIPRFAKLWRWIASMPYDAMIRRTIRSVLPWRVRNALHNALHKMLISGRPQAVKPLMPADVRMELLEYFRPEILELQELLNRDLSHWLR